MANKDKIIKQAGKYIAKGQLDKAIKELQKAVALDPADVRTLLKLGDVYSKKEDRENATKIYRQVADSYSEQGFFLKAVAVHKQILKHDGDNLEVRLKLAELYEQLGLASEAQSQYQEVARIHDAKGDMQGSLQVLERLVDLDSENVASRIKLAEGYSRAGQVEAAVRAFAKAAEVLKRQNRIEDYVKVAERLVYHDPDRFEVVKDLARVYLSRGDTKRGLAKLQLCFKAQPRDVETLTLLSQAFLELGQTQKTIFVYKELASVHAEAGRIDEAQAMHRRILEVDPHDPDAAAALGARSGGQAPHSGPAPGPASYPAAPASAPASYPPAAPASGPVPRSDPAPEERPRLASDLAPPSPSLAPRPTAPPPPPHASGPAPSFAAPPRAPSFAPRPPAPTETPDIPIEAPVPSMTSSPGTDGFGRRTPDPESEVERKIQDIITETDVFVRYGLTDKALAHLRRVFELDPDNPIAYEKMRDIHLSVGDTARAAEAVANLMHAHVRNRDDAGLAAARAELERLAPGHPLAHGGLPGAIPPPGQPSADDHDDEDISIDITEDSGVIELGDIDAAPMPPAEDFGTDLSQDLVLEGDATSAEEEGAFPPPADLALVSDPTDAYSTPFVEGPSFDAFDPPSQSIDLSSPQTDEPELLDEPFFGEDEATMAMPGLFETEGQPTDRRDVPPIPDDDPFAENVVTEFADLEGEPVEAPADEDEAAEPTASGDAPDEDALDLDAELEEAEFYVDNGLEDEARDALDQILAVAPENPRALALRERLEAEAEAEADAPSPPPEPGPPPQSGPHPALPDFDTSELSLTPDMASADVDAAFEGFGDEATEDVEDPEGQYDMGMVMMETMHFDEAIAAFKNAAKAPSRTLSALEMIGNCHRQMGQPLDAIDFYVDALERGARGPAAVNLTYEIGAAYEEAGELQRALDWMERCGSQDPNHRDIGDRIASLATQLGAPKSNGADGQGDGPRGPTSSKKNKISYL